MPRDLRDGETVAGATHLRQSQRAAQHRVVAAKLQTPIGGGPTHGASTDRKAGGNRGQCARKPAIQPPRPVQLQAHIAIIRRDSRASVAQHHIQRGQSAIICLTPEQHRVERAETQPAIAQTAIEARPDYRDAADVGYAETVDQFHLDTLYRQVRIGGIADHHVRQDLAFGIDAVDGVGGGDARRFQLIADKVARNPVPLQPADHDEREKQQQQQHRSAAQREPPATRACRFAIRGIGNLIGRRCHRYHLRDGYGKGNEIVHISGAPSAEQR